MALKVDFSGINVYRPGGSGWTPPKDHVVYDMEGVGGGAPIFGTDEIADCLTALVVCRIIRGFERYGTILYVDARPWVEHD